MFCRHSHKGYCLWKALLCATVLVASGMILPGAEGQLRIKHWTTDEGLPQNRTGCLKQTRDGYLWMGTWYGLVRFNGLDFTVFNKFNTPELSEDTINSLDETEDGTLWIGTSGGLVSYRDHTFRRFTLSDHVPELAVWRVVASRSGGVWFATERSVLFFRQGKTSVALQFDLKIPIKRLEEDKAGWLNVVLEYAWLKISPDCSQVKTNFTFQHSGIRSLEFT